MTRTTSSRFLPALATLMLLTQPALAQTTSLTYSPVPDELWVGEEITPMIPTASGFIGGVVRYVVISAADNPILLPAGLELDETTGHITGTPTTVQDARTVNIAALAFGNTQRTDVDIEFPAVQKRPLAKPTGLMLKPGTLMSTSFTVQWNAVTGASGYTATATGNGRTHTGRVTDTEALFSDRVLITGNTDYTVSVRAIGDTNRYITPGPAAELRVKTVNRAPKLSLIRRVPTAFDQGRTTPVLNWLSILLYLIDEDGDRVTFEVESSRPDLVTAPLRQNRPILYPRFVASAGIDTAANLERQFLINVVRADSTSSGTSTLTIKAFDGADTTEFPLDLYVPWETMLLPAPVLTLRASDTALTVTWNEIPSAEEYRLEWKPSSESGWFHSGSSAKFLDVAGLHHEITGLESGTAYDVRIQSKDRTGPQLFSYGEYSARKTHRTSDRRGINLTPRSLRVEEGKTATYRVELASEPSGPVTVSVSGTSGTDLTVDKASLTFTSTTWNVPQTVTVTAREDDDSTDDRAILTHTATGANYNSVNDLLAVTVVDDDVAGLEFSTNSLTVPEGGSAIYTVKLKDPPTDTVTVTIGGEADGVTVDDTDGNMPGDQKTLTFTTSTWSTAQTVTVRAADDDNTVNESVTLSHTATGGGYESVSGNVSVMTVDDDASRGVTVSPTSLTIAEGSTGTYTVVLNTQPTGAVTVAVGGVSGDVSVSTTSLTFTSSTWNSAQTVTVTAAEDIDALADDAVTLTHTVSGADYASESAASVTVTITENDVRGVTVSPTSLAIAEGSTGTYTVVLNTQPTGAVTVAVGGASGDVSVSTTSLTFTSSTWNTAQTVTVTAAEDIDALTDDAVTLTHTVSGADYASESAASVTVTITENDVRGVTVSPTSLTIAEGSTDTYTVVLNTQPTGDVTVAVGGVSGDVSVSRTSLTFTSSTWNTAQTVTVTAAEDIDALTDDAVTLTHTVSGADYASESAASVTVTITENDVRGVTVSPTSLTIAEGSTDTYTVVLNTQPTGDVTVAVGGASGDVSVSTTSLTFTSSTWNTAQTVTVTAAEDIDALTDDAVTLTHTVSGADYASESAASVTVTITENDVRGVTVSPTSLTIAEGSTGTYTVVLNTQPTGDVTVAVGGASGDVSVSTTSLTFTSSTWNTAQTVTVTAAEDIDALTDDAVTLTHTVSGADYASESAASVTVTITENDVRGVTVSPTSLTIAEGSTGTYTVVLNTQPTGDVTVAVGGASGDVSVSTTSLTFTSATWNTAQTVTVTAAEDIDALTDDAVTLTHAVSGADYASESAASVTVTITENDDSLPTKVTNLRVTPGDGLLSVSWTAASVAPNGYSVRWRVQGPGTTLSAINTVEGTSFNILNLTNGTTYVVRVDTRNAANTGVQEGTNVSAVGTPVGLEFPARSLTVPEGGSNTYTVRLTTRPTGAVTVTIGPAADDVLGDISVSPSHLVFTMDNWNTAQTVTVAAAHDDDATDDTATLTHTAAGGGYEPASGSVTVTVDDDDTHGVTVSPTSLTIAEGSTGTYTVVLNTRPTGAVTVTVGGASGDVSVFPSTLTFTSTTWNTAQTVTVAAAEDDDTLADDAVTLTHTVSGADYASESAASVTVTITENDVRGVTVSPTSLTIAEGSTGTYTVVLNTQPTGAVTVTVGGASGDVSVSTTSLTFTSSTWNTAQTVTVTAAEDIDALADDAVTLTHTVSGADYASESAASVTVTITENDVRGVTVSPTSLTIAEGSTGTYAVVLNTRPTGGVTVTVGGASGDVSVSTTSLTFTSSTWNTAQTVTVTAAEDDDATADDAVTLTHTVSGADYTSESVASVTVIITENDTRGVTVSPTSLTIAEGSTGTYTVVLNTQPTGAVTVTVGGASGDVSVFPSTLIFTSSTWNTAQTVTVTAAEDNDATADDAVTLTHTVSGADYASESAASVTVTITENDTRGVTVSPTSLTIAEGSTGTYTVVLNTQPTGAVTVAVGGASGDVSVSTTSLTFTSSTWNSAQTVTVTAAEDDDALADDAVTLTHTVSGADYASESAASVTVTITENDPADGVTLCDSGG